MAAKPLHAQCHRDGRKQAECKGARCVVTATLAALKLRSEDWGGFTRHEGPLREAGEVQGGGATLHVYSNGVGVGNWLQDTNGSPNSQMLNSLMQMAYVIFAYFLGTFSHILHFLFYLLWVFGWVDENVPQ